MENIVIIVCSAVFLCIGLAVGYFIKDLKNLFKGQAAEDEIISMVNEGTESGEIEESEAAMINNIFEFGDKAAKDIMTDRSNIVAIDMSDKLEDAIEVMLDCGKSRFPVYSENIDHIVGIIHIKDAISAGRDKTNKKKTIEGVEGLIREAKFIPETRKVDALFSTMRAAKLQMVIVVDEYGQTAGIVAMRDILEEIVGDIDDEYDEEDDVIIAKEENKYIIDGLTKLEDLEKYLDISFEDENFETINGYLISKLEHIPDKKEKFEYAYKGYNFKVLSVENNMIKQILITRIALKDDKQADVEKAEAIE